MNHRKETEKQIIERYDREQLFSKEVRDEIRWRLDWARTRADLFKLKSKQQPREIA